MQPLCMAQHYQIFSIYRRPGESIDERVILDRATSGDHIIVAHHNQVRMSVSACGQVFISLIIYRESRLSVL